MRIALVYNLIHAEEVEAGGVDAVAEYDSEETIAALCAALRAGGHEVSAVEADLDVVERLIPSQPPQHLSVDAGCSSLRPLTHSSE